MKQNVYFLTPIILLTAIGAINWGLIGLFDINFIAQIFINQPYMLKISYILVGIAGIIALFIGRSKTSLIKGHNKIEPTIKHNVGPRQIINNESRAKAEQEKFISEGGNSQPTNSNLKR